MYLCKSVNLNIYGALLFVICVSTPCRCQRAPSLPVNLHSFDRFLRTTIPVPKGRSATIKDILVRFYGTNSTSPTTYSVTNIKKLFLDQNFDVNKPTVLYAHGYVEMSTDESTLSVVGAYLRHGGYNVLVLDWANLAFGNYILVGMDVATVGKVTAAVLYRLIKRGLPLEGIHLVGHSLGAHVVGNAARDLASRGLRIRRVTGLDPAYPGYYPSVLGTPLSKSDAIFVDAIHTDGGGYGAPDRTAHADYWPNEGRAKQPGCPSATVPFSDEDFCSHWRSWAFWAESVTGGEFLARKCDSYDSFLRGHCRENELVYMGLRATPNLQGNFYLRTAAKSPYAIGVAGAD